jgi:hypothetical protein
MLVHILFRSENSKGSAIRPIYDTRKERRVVDAVKVAVSLLYHCLESRRVSGSISRRQSDFEIGGSVSKVNIAEEFLHMFFLEPPYWWRRVTVKI